MVTAAQIDQLRTIEQNIVRNHLDDFLRDNGHIPGNRIVEWHNFLNSQVNAYNYLIPSDTMLYQAVEAIVGNNGIMTPNFNIYYQEVINLNQLINQNHVDNFEDYLPALPLPDLPDVEQLLAHGIQANEITGSLLLFGNSEDL